MLKITNAKKTRLQIIIILSIMYCNLFSSSSTVSSSTTAKRACNVRWEFTTFAMHTGCRNNCLPTQKCVLFYLSWIPFWRWLHDTSCSFWSINIYEGLSKGKLRDDKGNTLRIMRFSLLVLFPKGYVFATAEPQICRNCDRRNNITVVANLISIKAVFINAETSKKCS